MTNTQEPDRKGAYLCTFAVPFQGYGTGTMLGAYARLTNGVLRIGGELKRLGWKVEQTILDQGGHYFDNEFYQTYEAEMRGTKSKDISYETLEKIASEEGMKLIHSS